MLCLDGEPIEEGLFVRVPMGLDIPDPSVEETPLTQTQYRRAGGRRKDNSRENPLSQNVKERTDINIA